MAVISGDAAKSFMRLSGGTPRSGGEDDSKLDDKSLNLLSLISRLNGFARAGFSLHNNRETSVLQGFKKISYYII